MRLALIEPCGRRGLNKRVTSWVAVVLAAVALLPVSIGPQARNASSAQATAAVRSPASNLSQLARGKFLVADHRLRDPNFKQTVVLLLQYSPHGAMGFVVNRPTDVRLSEAISEIEQLKQREDTLYKGGPVPSEALYLLYRSEKKLDESNRVVQDVYLSASLGVLAQLVAGAGGKNDFRLYVGHAGWAPGQLDREVERGDWHVVDAASDLIFAEKPSTVWQRSVPRSPTQVAMAVDREPPNE
jgi:putative transcriptional regulator